MTAQERGASAMELPLVIGLLLIPFGLLILTIPTWVERQTAAREAASESARSLVMPDGVDPADVLARVEVGYGLAPGSLGLLGAPSGPLYAGSSVTVRVTVELPGPDLPFFGPIGNRRWTTEHTERVPDHGARS